MRCSAGLISLHTCPGRILIPLSLTSPLYSTVQYITIQYSTVQYTDSHLSTVMARMVRTEVWDTVSSMKGTRRHMALPITQIS